MSRTNNPSPARRPIDAAQPNRAQLDTAAAIGFSVIQQRERLDPTQFEDEEHLARIVIHSVLGLSSEHLAAVVEEPASTGASNWDALLQGLVAWRCHSVSPRIQTPTWAKEAHLDEAWAPFGGSIRDDGWYTLSVLSTPVELLHRGVVLDRNNLVEL